ncbi:MAG: hypothetical protein P9L99_05170 [Candidatus Lernaella stagnicola]|nr:hypothetical protein [Candidatus Lernaella stagnicola]
MKKALLTVFLVAVAGLVLLHVLTHEPPAEPIMQTPDTPAPPPDCSRYRPPERDWSQRCPNRHCVAWETALDDRLWRDSIWDKSCRCAYEPMVDHPEIARAARPKSAEQLREEIAAAEQGAPQKPADAAAARRMILERTGVAAWPARERLVFARVCHNQPRGSGRLLGILVHDELVGVFRLAVWVPERTGRLPAVVALHGHGENAEVALERRNAENFVAAGYVFASPTSRCITGDAVTVEHEITERFLTAGYSFLAVRTYELALVRRVLAGLDFVDETRLGLLGHSSGAMLVNALMHADDFGFRAAVSDRSGPYLNRNPDGLYLDTLTPALSPLADYLADPRTSRVPLLAQPYGFPDGPKPAIEFFDHHLNNGPS